MLALLAPSVGVTRDGAAGVAVLPPPTEADVLLVQPAPGLAVAALAAGLEQLGLRTLPASPLAGAVRVAVPPGADPAALAARIAASGLARGVEADGHVAVARLPDDPYFGAGQAHYLREVRAEEAWEVTTGDQSVIVAIVDSGVDLTHPDLAGRLALNLADSRIDGVDADRNGCTDDVAGCSFVALETADPSCGYRYAPPHWLTGDDEGHGTFVAGIAAAAGDNGRGIAGVAWDVRILPVKVLDCTATGRVADAAAGIRYAARRGADVINVSFGTRRDSSVLREAVLEAQALGSVVVASAGNDAGVGATYPAAYPGVLGVAASGLIVDGTLDYHRAAEFSPVGEGVALLAPGRAIASTVPPHLCGARGWHCGDGPYATASGTSFAAPLVTGAVALLRSQHPELGPALVRSLLLGALDHQGAGGGPGLLDLAAPLEAAVFGVGLPGTSHGGAAGDAEAGGAPPGPAPGTP